MTRKQQETVDWLRDNQPAIYSSEDRGLTGASGTFFPVSKVTLNRLVEDEILNLRISRAGPDDKQEIYTVRIQ